MTTPVLSLVDPLRLKLPVFKQEGRCAETDPEAFFPEKGGSADEAKRICRRCEVRGECLEWAIVHDERYGVWGGMSERERRKAARTRGIRVAP